MIRAKEAANKIGCTVTTLYRYAKLYNLGKTAGNCNNGLVKLQFDKEDIVFIKNMMKDPSFKKIKQCSYYNDVTGSYHSLTM